MRKVFVRLGLAVAIMAGLGMATVPANAEPALTACTMAGANTLVKNAITGRYAWTVHAVGSCINPASTHFAELTLAGSSQGLGECDGGPLQDLDLVGALTLTSTTTGLIRTVPLRFYSPVTSYPVVTPFLISQMSGLTGAGTLFTHIFLACPPLGTPASQLVFEILL
ncbi:MAG: hypothetical protein QOF21_2390 [Actinomycetota bacterium]|jgi:hypothetical protein